MRKFSKLVLLGLLAVVGARASASPARLDLSQAPGRATSISAPAANVPAEQGTPLTKIDADSWLDGFVPYALQSSDIAGGVVVIVKDGKILTQRGYGFADIAKRRRVDPDSTMFRVGSTSKLFTWTAVMQLAEQGKIDLDADVNRYLDFTIPPFHGKPITMRNIMTHRAGFQEVVKGGIRYSGKVDPLGVALRRLLPARVYDPGTTPAYSNYATALAGYIVERVSGIPFDNYIEQKIFAPLGMTHSSFRQPLPARLAPFMATGYDRASGDPQPFELIAVGPPGSLSMSGSDAGKFMIAQLAEGAGLFRPQTAKMMQTPAYGAIPGLNRMALGFYEQRLNGLSVIAHGGDLLNFHGYMWLFPQKNVGLLIEMNSRGEVDSTARIREALFEKFADRYFPAADQRPQVELRTATAHARMLTGNYLPSEREFTTFLDFANLLGQIQIGLDADGRPSVPEIFEAPPRKWIEVSPFIWQEANGHARLGATVQNGEVVRWGINELSPFLVFDRVPWYRDASWLLPLFMAALGVVSIAALYLPAGAIVRRRYGVALALTGNDLTARRLALGASWLVVAGFACWAYVFVVHLGSMSTSDWPILLARVVGSIAFICLPFAAAWNALLVWKRPTGWFARIAATLLLAAALVVFWVTFDFHLIGLSTRY